MAYIPVDKLEEVSVGQNMHCDDDVIFLRKSRTSDTVYAKIKNKYYKISNEGVFENTKYQHNLYKYGTTTRNLYARFIAFKLIVRGKSSLYFTITDKNSHIPILIHQTLELDEDSNGKNIIITNFCYNPIKSKEGRGYIGTIGSVSDDLYNTAYNKARLLDRPMPKVDYVKKAIKLKEEIENSKDIPLAYKPEHESIYIKDVYPQEMNKLFFVSKLRYIIENYSSGKIYYSGSLKNIEKRYKEVRKYFKHVITT